LFPGEKERVYMMQEKIDRRGEGAAVQEGEGRLFTNEAAGEAWPLSREKFVSIMQRLQDTRDLTDSINELLKKNRVSLNPDCGESGGLLISHEEEVIELLELLMRDRTEDIWYFVNERDFGRKNKAEDDEASELPFADAGTLYEYLQGRAED
jgi:hypothetical protein